MNKRNAFLQWLRETARQHAEEDERGYPYECQCQACRDMREIDEAENQRSY